MKKILALMLALMLAFSCCAMAEETVDSMTITGSLTFDAGQITSLAAMFGLGEAYQPIVNVVLSILNSLGGRVVISGKGMQGELLLKDGAVATVSSVDIEGGIAIASDLFPNYVITVTDETLQPILEMLQQSTEKQLSLESLDLEALAASMIPTLTETIEEINAHLGMPEMGVFTVDGFSFNVKVPLNMTYKEMALLSAKLIKSLMENEEVASALAMLSSSAPIDLSQLDESIAQIEAADDTDLPQFTGNYYYMIGVTGTPTASYGVFEIVSGEETQTITAGMVDGAYLLTVQTGSMQLAITATGDENSLSLRADITASGMYIGLTLDFASVNSVTASELKLYFMSKQAPLMTVSLAIVPGGEITAEFDAEGKTVVALENLMNDGEAMNGLMTDVQSYGLSSLLVNATMQMPEEISALLALFMPSQTAVGE